MKKIFLLVMVVTMLASGNLFAQVSGGVRLGGNLSNIKYSAGDFSATDDSKFGPLFGLYLTAMFADKVGLQPELVYSAMGSKDGDAKLNLGYIALPVLLRYQIIEQIHLLLGPQAAFLLSAKYKEGDDDEDVKDSFKGLDFSAVVGAGADIDRFNVGLRYGFGLANIIENEGEDLKVKSSTFQIVLGYKLFGD